MTTTGTVLQVLLYTTIMQPLTILLSTLLLPALTLSYSLTITIPSTPLLPDPRTLPPSTTCSLTTPPHEYTAHLTTTNTFHFRNISTGSYLLSIACASHAFAPLRVDVENDGTIEAWRTFRGNEWENRGESVMNGKTIEAKVLGVKEYYMERAGCEFVFFLFSPSILSNPTIITRASYGTN